MKEKIIKASKNIYDLSDIIQKFLLSKDEKEFNEIIEELGFIESQFIFYETFSTKKMSKDDAFEYFNSLSEKFFNHRLVTAFVFECIAKARRKRQEEQKAPEEDNIKADAFLRKNQNFLLDLSLFFKKATNSDIRSLFKEINLDDESIKNILIESVSFAKDEKIITIDSLYTHLYKKNINLISIFLPALLLNYASKTSSLSVREKPNSLNTPLAAFFKYLNKITKKMSEESIENFIIDFDIDVDFEGLKKFFNEHSNDDTNIADLLIEQTNKIINNNLHKNTSLLTFFFFLSFISGVIGSGRLISEVFEESIYSNKPIDKNDETVIH